MNVTHDNFIAVYENAVPDEVCDRLISYYEYCKTLNLTISRQRGEGISALQKKDDTTFFNESILVANALDKIENKDEYILNHHMMFDEVTDYLGQCSSDYVSNYDVLKNIEIQLYLVNRLQKTQPTGGYHAWHCEYVGDDPRAFVYTLYLNDVEEGGETEFLYLSKRVKPKKGTICIFPAGYTHTHRGNPPLSGDKYILTGWWHFMPERRR